MQTELCRVLEFGCKPRWKTASFPDHDHDPIAQVPESGGTFIDEVLH